MVNYDVLDCDQDEEYHRANESPAYVSAMSILSLVVFFAVGLLLLSRVDIRKATIEAGNTPPA